MRCASAESSRRACQSRVQRSSAPSLHARHSPIKPAQKLLLSCSFGHAALPPRIPKQLLRISYLLTYYLFSIWLVCEYHYTRAECLRLNKFEFLLLALPMKKPFPVSYYYGEDHETVFINEIDRKSTRLNSSHVEISYAVFCLKKKTNTNKYQKNINI